jgi:hypothetical protein
MQTCYHRLLIFLSGMRKDLPIPTGTPQKIRLANARYKGTGSKTQTEKCPSNFFVLGDTGEREGKTREER